MPAEADFDGSVAQIEASVKSACDRLPDQAESVAAALALQHSMSQESRTALLSMEIFAGECANLAAWLLHLRGEHSKAREVVHLARCVQRALSETLQKP